MRRKGRACANDKELAISEGLAYMQRINTNLGEGSGGYERPGTRSESNLEEAFTA